MPRGPNVAYRQQKINWLMANPALWEDFPRGCQYFRIVERYEERGTNRPHHPMGRCPASQTGATGKGAAPATATGGDMTKGRIVLVIGNSNPISEALRMLINAPAAPSGSKDCSRCEHRFMDNGGGHCYMFEKEPEGDVCGQFKKDVDK